MRLRLRKKTESLILCTFLLYPLFASASLSGENKGLVEIQLTSPVPVEAKPRQPFTLAFRVSNLTPQPHEFSSSIVLPNDWKTVTGDFSFTLKPAETSIRLVTLVVPMKVLAGVYQVHYQVKSNGDPEVQGRITTDIRVPLVAKLAVRTMNAPQMVIAGETYQAQFLVINESNAPFTVAISVKSTEGYPCRYDQNELNLKAGESRPLTVSIETDPRAKGKHSHHLELWAEVKNLKEDRVRASGFTSADVIPLESGEGDLYQRLPAKVRFIGFSAKGSGQVGQIEITGVGCFKNKATKRVDFLFRGPGRTELMTFGFQREEYRLFLERDKGSIYLGDRVYSLSKLSEYGHYGRGAEGKFDLGRFSLKGYYQEVLMEVPKRNQKAFQLIYNILKGRALFSLNYLANKIESRPEDHVYSLETQYNSEPFSLHVEYALGRRGADQASRMDSALWLETFGSLTDRLSYRFSRIQAGSDYPGSYSDLIFNSGQIHISPFRNLSLRASYSDMESNLRRNPVFTANDEKYVLFGMQYQLLKSIYVSFEHKRQDRKSLFPSPLFDYRDTTLRFGLNPHFGPFNLYSLVDVGKTYNRLSHERRDLIEYNVSSHITLFRKLSLEGYFQYRDQDSEFTGDKERGTNVRFNLGLNLGKTHLQAFYRTSQYFEFYNQILYDQSLVEELLQSQMSFFEVGIEQGLFHGHSIALRVRHAILFPRDARKKEDIMGLIEYSIPLGIPVGRNLEEGEFSGRVYDAEADRKGITGVIVKVGGRATVTNEEGRFVFHGLQPGQYTLDIERRTLGPNRVTILQTPMEREIIGGQKNKFDLGVVASATISGRAVVYRFEGEDSPTLIRPEDEKEEKKLVENQGLSDTLIELKGESDIFHQLTDDAGFFRFDGLRPGKWTLKIFDNNLPELYYIEKDTFDFELSFGSAEKVLVKVLPKARQIKIIEKGEIQSKKR